MNYLEPQEFLPGEASPRLKGMHEVDRDPSHRSPNQLRILHVSQPTEAGVPNVLLAYAQDQLARGWDVHVACPGDEGYLSASARRLGATHHDWSAHRSPGRQSFGEARRLRRMIDSIDPDVVHLHSSKAGLTGRLALRGSRPTLFQPHAWSFEAATGATGRGAIVWEHWARRWTTMTVCVSQSRPIAGVPPGLSGSTTR